MNIAKNLKFLFLIFLSAIFLNSCGGKLPGADARKYPPNPEARVKKNIEEGRGFRLSDVGKNKGGTFEFASSNELWRASLDTIDFMPLASVNYSGGIIITDWYSSNVDNESIKISIRFLTNEVRSDALDIKVFNRKCNVQFNCVITEKSGNLVSELTNKILKTAAVYEKQMKDKNFKPYITSDPKD
ncbi:DUF3576 domain-containing protein [Candidatus Pelagibacter ubique]|jgi:hypothetical protein|uniref:DUF3576 domain-containing protein n=1 Tax=Pelagibacter ubique TaxID=198252 RepID=UPI000411B30B|nr:DUF3576 domain-containing protein [Candidatus Pelagibacter ubique]MDA7469681.1 DUF3576 domain-containing protein [Candidatus Pelagibacter ubique]